MTADPRAVEIIAEATAQHHLDPDRTDADRHSFCVCGGWAEGEMEPGWDDHMADVAVAALEAAGWSLLPPGGETRTWSLPGEPGPEVTAVRTKGDMLWRRTGEKWRYVENGQAYESTWDAIMRGYGPLADASATTREAPSE